MSKVLRVNECSPFNVSWFCVVSVKPVGPSNVLSMAQLRTLPLVDQVKTLMKNGRMRRWTEAHIICCCCDGIISLLMCFPLCPLCFVVKVIQFANLMGLLASGTDSTSVLRCIQQVALLVQGNWVVKR